MKLFKAIGKLKEFKDSPLKFGEWYSSLSPKEEALLVYDDAVDDIEDWAVFGHFVQETLLPESMTGREVECIDCGNTIICCKKASMAFVYRIGKCAKCGHKHESFY